MNFSQFAKTYLEDLQQAFSRMDLDAFASLATAMNAARDTGNQIFVMGNGGSAATATHFTCDINKGACLELDKKFRMVSLSDNISLITAIANDIDYASIFVEQLKNHFTKGDLVIGISGSGNSENVLCAIDYANKNGGVTAGISGFDGGKLAEMADIPVVIPVHDMQKVEDGQMVVVHMLMQSLRKSQGLAVACGCG